MVYCKLCNKSFEVISGTHLLSVHGIKIGEYIQKFGNKQVGFVVKVSDFKKDDPRYLAWRKSLRKRNTAWAKGFTKKTHPGLTKRSETFKRLKIDNFRKWREEARLLGKIPTSYPEFLKDENLAFLLGMVLGDGHIQKLPRTEGLKIVLSTKYPGLVHYTSKTVEKVFNKVPRVRKIKNSECFTIVIYQKYISKRLGIPCGNRSELNFKVPDWVSEDEEFLLNFLRGLFEAEGSLSVHLPTCTYNFSFSNKNKSLLNIVEKYLKLLNYNPEVRPVAIHLRRKKEVERFKQLINFRIY